MRLMKTFKRGRSPSGIGGNQLSGDSTISKTIAPKDQMLESPTVSKASSGGKMKLQAKLEFDALESNFVSRSASSSSSRASHETFPSTISPNDGSTSTYSSLDNLQLLEEIKLEDHLTRPIETMADTKTRRNKQKKSKKKRGSSLEREISQLILGNVSKAIDPKPDNDKQAKDSMTAQFILSDLGLEVPEIADINESPSRADTLFQGLEDSLRPMPNNRTVLEPTPEMTALNPISSNSDNNVTKQPLESASAPKHVNPRDDSPVLAPSPRDASNDKTVPKTKTDGVRRRPLASAPRRARPSVNKPAPPPPNTSVTGNSPHVKTNTSAVLQAPAPARPTQEATQRVTPHSAVRLIQSNATIISQASTLLSDVTKPKLDPPAKDEVNENEKDDIFSTDFDDDWTAFETSSFFQPKNSQDAAKQSKPKTFFSSPSYFQSVGPTTGSASRATQRAKSFTSSSSSVQSVGPATGIASRSAQKAKNVASSASSVQSVGPATGSSISRARIKRIFGGKRRSNGHGSAKSLDGSSSSSDLVKTKTPQFTIRPLSRQPRESRSATIRRLGNLHQKNVEPFQVQLPRHRQNMITL